MEVCSILIKIILVRHCQAEGNEKRFFQGTIDTEITEKGKKQIEATVKRLEDENIDLVYSSPLKRAVATASGIAESHGIAQDKIIIENDLKEIDAGVFDGMAIKDVVRLFPEQSDNWDNHPERFKPDGSEGMENVYKRAGRVLKKLIGENEGKCVCVVSHGCLIRNILCNAYGKPLDELKTVSWGMNCSVSVVIADGDWTEVVLENDSEHLS